MSVQSEIDRIAGAKSDISTAITNKGVTVPSGTKLDGMAALIDSIESGGGGYKGEWTEGTTYNTDDIVTYRGNVYRCLNENTDSIPANYIGMYWEKLNIADSTPIEISTDAGMEAVLTSDNVGKVYKFTGTTGTYTNGDLYVVEVG